MHILLVFIQTRVILARSPAQAFDESIKTFVFSIFFRDNFAVHSVLLYYMLYVLQSVMRNRLLQ